MSYIEINTDKVADNIAKLNALMQKWGRKWTLVMKVLGANREAISRLLKHQVISQVHSVGDSHISGLKVVKEINPNLTTMYIKPPALRYIKSVVRYADISLNTSFKTIEALNEEAARQNKVHKVVVMVELGELREGIVREEILNFYHRIFELSNIDVIALGTNLGCMHGVEPSYDKLIQLCLYEQLIEAHFNRKLELVSGGSSITLPLLLKGKLPKGVSHFRIGEAAFLGTEPLNDKKFRQQNTTAFTFKAHIVEIYKKDSVPDGNISDAAVGHTADPISTKASFKAIVDFGALDVEPSNLTPQLKGMQFFGNSSDMTVWDVGTNPHKLKSGDIITFKPNYMAVARLMNSRFVDKVIKGGE